MIKRIVILLILFLNIKTLMASEKMPYTHMGVIGFGKSYGSDYNGPLSPVLFYSNYLSRYKKDGPFSKFQATTTTASWTLGTVFGAGTFGNVLAINPKINHTTYGAYSEFDMGIDNKESTYKGNNTGVEIYYRIYAPAMVFPNEFFSLKLSYYPAYNFFQENDETTIQLPENHWIHNGGAELKIEFVESKSLNRVKQGVLLKVNYLYSYRQGWENQIETLTGEISDFKETHRIYGHAGFYHVLPVPGDINMQFDFTGSWQKNVDRSNAEQIGSYVADFGTMPGYYFSEFIHDRFFIAKMQLGLPLGFWKGRIQPGFNVLYMPEDNRVLGKKDYPLTSYRSVSVSTSLYLFDTLPFFVDYAYGMDAQRRVKETGEIKKGNHEVRAFCVFAFGEIK